MGLPTGTPPCFGLEPPVWPGSGTPWPDGSPSVPAGGNWESLQPRGQGSGPWVRGPLRAPQRDALPPGLEPEIQKLIARHKQEVKKLKSVHEAELLQADARAAQRCARQVEELREQLEREKEALGQQERERAQQRWVPWTRGPGPGELGRPGGGGRG